ncbi:MAG: rhomboid family intramembrane serine protease [Janthinobacterium lividum]
MFNRVAEVRAAAGLRQPIFNIPAGVLAILLVLVGMHLGRQVIPETWDEALFSHLAFVPGRLTYAIAPDRVVASAVGLAGQGADGYRQAQIERFVVGDGSSDLWTTVTYALLHADWAHIGLNAVWLLAFGSPVARRFETWRFFAFLIVTAWAGALVQWAAHPLDFMPVIGASAAVSGCMGASLRFMFQPHVPMAAIIDTDEQGRGQAFVQPALTLRQVLTERRAVTFMVAWFATNLLFGLGSVSFGMGGPIAWEAHIGGFATGLILFSLFDPVRPVSVAHVETAIPPDTTAEV